MRPLPSLSSLPSRQDLYLATLTVHLQIDEGTRAAGLGAHPALTRPLTRQLPAEVLPVTDAVAPVT